MLKSEIALLAGVFCLQGWGAFCATASAPYSQELTDYAVNMVRGQGPEGLVSGSGEASTLLFLYGAT